MLTSSKANFHKVSKDYLKAEDIEFIVRDKNTSMCISSYEVGSIDESLVLGVTVTVASAKNDQHGEGNKVSFPKSGPSSSAFNITTMLFRWAKRAQLQSGEAFFSYRSSWRLSYRDLCKAHKGIAEVC